MATDAASFQAFAAADQGDSPIFSKEVLDTLMGASYEDFAKAVAEDRN